MKNLGTEVKNILDVTNSWLGTVPQNDEFWKHAVETIQNEE